MCKLHCTLCGTVPVTNRYSGSLAVLIVLALVFRLFKPGASFIHVWGCRHKRCPEASSSLASLPYKSCGNHLKVSRAEGGMEAVL